MSLIVRAAAAFELHFSERRDEWPRKPQQRKRRAGRRRRSAKLIDTGADKRFVRRGARGKFKESDDVGKSLTADRRKKAKTKVKSGQGDKGDR